MKSFTAASVLFLSVIVMISVNFFMLDKLLDYTDDKLNEIPETIVETENMSDSEKKKISDTLNSIEKEWKDKETFICLSLRHNIGREFMINMVSAISYFESEEYSEYLAQIMLAKNTVEHIRYDESIGLGNIL